MNKTDPLRLTKDLEVKPEPTTQNLLEWLFILRPGRYVSLIVEVVPRLPSELVTTDCSDSSRRTEPRTPTLV